MVEYLRSAQKGGVRNLLLIEGKFASRSRRLSDLDAIVVEAAEPNQRVDLVRNLRAEIQPPKPPKPTRSEPPKPPKPKIQTHRETSFCTKMRCTRCNRRE